MNQVHDHADRLHEVVMEPGDIVYYGKNSMTTSVSCFKIQFSHQTRFIPYSIVQTESAKALHGRNTPLQSGSYVNLFTHYRPLNDPEWYLRDTPVGTPAPLMDVGECHLEGGLDEYSQGAVKCDNEAIGPHLSPKMFNARNGMDLFNWWKTVGPDEVDKSEVSSEDEL